MTDKTQRPNPEHPTPEPFPIGTRVLYRQWGGPTIEATVVNHGDSDKGHTYTLQHAHGQNWAFLHQLSLAPQPQPVERRAAGRRAVEVTVGEIEHPSDLQDAQRRIARLRDVQTVRCLSADFENESATFQIITTLSPEDLRASLELAEICL